jgi:molybdopterin synthase sulfur carrier subunit
MIKILYFASLRETLDTSSEQLDLNSISNVGQLVQHLTARDDAWKQALTSDQAVLVAVNQQMAEDDTLLKDGDEVAFFPPVTGG